MCVRVCETEAGQERECRGRERLRLIKEKGLFFLGGSVGAPHKPSLVYDRGTLIQFAPWWRDCYWFVITLP